MALKEKKDKQILIKPLLSNWASQGDYIIGIYYWRIRDVPDLLPFATIKCSFYSGAIKEIQLKELPDSWKKHVNNRNYNDASFIPQGGSRGMRGIPLKNICNICYFFSEAPHICATPDII